MNHRLQTTALLSFMALSFVSLPAVASSLQAATIQGFGTLKFGMTPVAVAALEDCSSQTECLYDILGKNRYFTLGYGPDAGAPDAIAPSGDGATPATLSHIDIEMGTYTQEWFLEVFEVLAAQYPLDHQPTEREQAGFEQGHIQELVIGFVDGFVLLKVVRRPFGNVIIHVVYQDAARAQAQRKLWHAAVAATGRKDHDEP